MADEPKYPLEKAAFAPTDRAMAESWLHSLEVIGPKKTFGLILHKLAQWGRVRRSRSVQHMSAGFAQQWVAWHDKLKSERDRR